MNVLLFRAGDAIGKCGAFRNFSRGMKRSQESEARSQNRDEDELKWVNSERKDMLVTFPLGKSFLVDRAHFFIDLPTHLR